MSLIILSCKKHLFSLFTFYLPTELSSFNFTCLLFGWCFHTHQHITYPPPHSWNNLAFKTPPVIHLTSTPVFVEYSPSTDFPDLPWIDHIPNPFQERLKRGLKADSCKIRQLITKTTPCLWAICKLASLYSAWSQTEW